MCPCILSLSNINNSTARPLVMDRLLKAPGSRPRRRMSCGLWICKLDKIRIRKLENDILWEEEDFM